MLNSQTQIEELCQDIYRLKDNQEAAQRKLDRVQSSTPNLRQLILIGCPVLPFASLRGPLYVQVKDYEEELNGRIHTLHSEVKLLCDEEASGDADHQRKDSYTLAITLEDQLSSMSTVGTAVYATAVYATAVYATAVYATAVYATATGCPECAVKCLCRGPSQSTAISLTCVCCAHRNWRV
jgi:hypothetical protein